MAKSNITETDILLIEEAHQALLGLSTEHLEINKLFRVEGEKTVQEWLSFLETLNAYDTLRDTAVQKLRRGSWRNFGGRIAVWGTIMCLIVYVGSVVVELPIPFWIVLSAISTCILAGVIYRYSPKGKKLATLSQKLKAAEKLDYPNSIRNYVFPLVRMLREECRETAPLQLFLNLRSRVFDIGADTLPANFKTRSGYVLQNTSFSEYDHFQFSTRLYDGSILSYGLQDQIRRRYFSRTKRSVSGKYKTKTKYKYKTKITHTLKLSVPKKMYHLRAPAADQEITISQTENEKRYIFKVKEAQYKKTNLGSAYQPKLEELLVLVSNVYKRLEKRTQTP